MWRLAMLEIEELRLAMDYEPAGNVQRECADVVTQIAAAAKALEQVGFKLVASGLTYCLAHPDQAAEAGYDLDRVEKMFMKIG